MPGIKPGMTKVISVSIKGAAFHRVLQRPPSGGRFALSREGTRSFTMSGMPQGTLLAAP
jgi:hypothetical protein